MELIKLNPTLKRALNKLVRTPQRQNGTKLQSGATAIISVFKNKQIIHVIAEVESRFNSKI
jgi:hypothetical protein